MVSTVTLLYSFPRQFATDHGRRACSAGWTFYKMFGNLLACHQHRQIGKQNDCQWVILSQGDTFLQHSFRNKFIKMRTKTLGKLKLDSSTAVWPRWAPSREISLLRTGDSEWQVSQRAVWNSLLGNKYHVYQSCQHPVPSFAHLQMTSSWIWLPSLSLSLDEQGRKGVIYCIYLCIYLFIWLTARKSIPPLPSWQGFREGAGGCVGAEAPEWLHTTPWLFTGTEKRFPSTGFPYCSAGRNRAGHALSGPDLISNRSHRCIA